jgi:hypothetical protein
LRLAAWRADRREDLLEDLICDAPPRWDRGALRADPVALDLLQVRCQPARPRRYHAYPVATTG